VIWAFLFLVLAIMAGAYGYNKLAAPCGCKDH
jgi:uncharacterized membrane protein YtjA (UPF0391 family)